ncbi:MAG: metallophosphoesterase [Myxococcales bacterium]|nr:metallophosphoesterase [Myxococcales bacterium]
MVAITLALMALAPYEQYQVDNETTCISKADHAFAAADVWTADGFRFELAGARAEVHAAQPKEARLGLLSAIKDFSPETRANLTQFLAAFRKAGVAGVIVDGDSAYGVDDQDSTLADLFTWLGGQGLPVYAIIGNSESRSSFNRALLAAYRKHPNVINLNLVRRVEGDGFTLVSLPGYYDQRYIHESAGCRYKPEDAQELTRIARGAPSPVVLVTHGPPRQSGRAALDVTEDGHNVGDPDLAAAIAEAKINFGVFGHILESGGRATDLDGRKPVKPGLVAPALYVNPGPAFADRWALNSGGTSRGMAAILTLRNGKGEWQPVRAGVADPRARLVRHRSN